VLRWKVCGIGAEGVESSGYLRGSVESSLRLMEKHSQSPTFGAPRAIYDGGLFQTTDFCRRTRLAALFPYTPGEPRDVSSARVAPFASSKSQ